MGLLLESTRDAGVQQSLVVVADADADGTAGCPAGRVVRANRERVHGAQNPSGYDEAIRVYYRESGHVDKVRLLRYWRLGACG